MTTIVTIDMGGTGATHAAGARDALSVPSMADMGQSYAQANSARDQANNARSDANTTFGTINTTFGTVNTSLGTMNTQLYSAQTWANIVSFAAYAQANTASNTANDAYGAANTKLASAGGTLSGDLIITGNLTVSGNSTTLNTEILTVEDAEIVLLSNVASTPALNAGVIVNRGTSTNTFLRWDEALDEWGWSDSGNTTYYFEDLRQGLSTTNTTFGTVNTSLGTINTSYQAAYAQANTAGTNALNAYGQANSAYGAANNAVLKAGDTMTGQLNISSGGLLVTGNANFDSTTLFVDSVNDRVGINTSTPGYRLTVAGSSGTAALSLVESGVRNWIIDAGGQSTNTFRIADITAGSARLLIDSSGNVGIGTTSPTAALHVSGTSGDASPTFRINGTAAASVFNWAGSIMNSSLGSGYNTILLIGKSESNRNSGYIGFNHSGTNGSNTNFLTFGLHSVDNVLNITGAGNVGIGTTSPAAKLDIYPGGSDLGVGANGIRVQRPASYGQYGYLEYLISSDVTVLGSLYTGGGASAFGQIYLRQHSSTTSRDSMVINSSGNVGIGTTSPQNLFHVSGSSQNVRFSNFSTDSAGLLISYQNSSTHGLNLMYRPNDATCYIDSTYQASAGTVYGDLIFRQNVAGTMTPRMTIKADGGNVGIGNTAPNHVLSVNGTAFIGGNTTIIGGTTTVFDVRAADAGYAMVRVGTSTNGSQTTGAVEVTQEGTYGGGMFYNGDGSPSFATGENAGGDVITFYRMNAGTRVAVFEYPYSSNTVTFKGDVSINGTLTESSSIALKENINPITNALELISQICGVTYDRKDGSAKERAGLIAEEVEQVLPNVVQKDNDGNPSGIQYTNLIAYLVESIKELKAEIDILKRQ